MARMHMPGVRPLRTGLILVCVAGVALAITGTVVLAGRPIRIRIATGVRNGAYHPLGDGLAQALEHDMDDVRATVLETGGSEENVALLRDGRAELALIQNDTRAPRSVQMIAPIFPEVLHIVVRDGIDDVDDLRGARVAGGAEGSGTSRLIEKVLRFLRLPVRMQHPSMAHALELFRQGRVDAVALVSGLRSSAVDELLRVPGAHLLSLGPPDARGSVLEGFEVNYPFATPAIIPQGTYGREPAQPIGTLSVHAILVARADLDEDLAYDIAQALYANRMLLMRHHPVAHYLREDYDPSKIGLPIHPGADAYRRRDEPSFLERYSEMMSLLFGILMAFGSAVLALRQLLARARRNEVEGYYKRVEKAVAASESAEELPRAAAALRELQREALRDLIADRLEADQSFTIFQDYLRSELLGIEQRIAELSRNDR